MTRLPPAEQPRGLSTQLIYTSCTMTFKFFVFLCKMVRSDALERRQPAPADASVHGAGRAEQFKLAWHRAAMPASRQRSRDQREKREYARIRFHGTRCGTDDGRDRNVNWIVLARVLYIHIIPCMDSLRLCPPCQLRSAEAD